MSSAWGPCLTSEEQGRYVIINHCIFGQRTSQIGEFIHDIQEALSIVIFSGTWLVPGFGWNITDFFRLIVSPNPNRRSALVRDDDALCVVD